MSKQLKIQGLFLILLFLLSFKMQGQIDLGEDKTINAGIPVQLKATFLGTYGTMIEAWDDAFEGKFSIGFPFTFYEEIFDSVSLSPNSVLSFDDNPPTYYFQMLPIPNAEFTKSIMGPYQDLFTRPMDSPHNKYMYYGIVGEEPNRRFVAGWCKAPMYSCSDKNVSTQIVLEEGSNIVYNHLFNKPECTSSQGNRASQGLNYDITKGIAVAGRNNSSWTATNESWQFIPTSNSYEVKEIDFEPAWVFPKNSVSFAWYKEATLKENKISDSWSVIVAPTQTTTYYGVMTVCDNFQFIKKLTVNVIPMPTAFNPNSYITSNRTFGFQSNEELDLKNFSFQIFNRWGVNVFSSSNPAEKWDGKINGKDCMTDTYTWIVKFALDDDLIQNTGTVTLVR